jgi:hypothetical protein
MVNGVGIPEATNSEEDTAIRVMVIASCPVLVNVAVCVACWPTCTPAKVMSAGLICTAAWGVGFAFELLANPAHPLSTMTLHARTANIPAIALPLPALPANFPAALPLVALPLAIIFPSGLSVRECRLRRRLLRKILVGRSIKGQLFPCPAGHRSHPYFL